MSSLAAIADRPVDHAAMVVVSADGAVVAEHGPGDRRFGPASVTKPLVACAALLAVEEEAVTLDQRASPEGATIRHLLAHTSSLAFGEHRAGAEPGARRLYSSAGFEVLADTIAETTGIAFADNLHEAVLAPLGMVATSLHGAAGHAATSTADDLRAFAAELQTPTLLDPPTVRLLTVVCSGVACQMTSDVRARPRAVFHASSPRSPRPASPRDGTTPAPCPAVTPVDTRGRSIRERPLKRQP